MKNPLDSLLGTVVCGVILTVLFYNAVTFVMH